MLENEIAIISAQLDYESVRGLHPKVYESWQTLKAAVLTQQAPDNAMMPCECIHGIAINKDCSVCKEFMGVGRRVVAQHQ